MTTLLVFAGLYCLIAACVTAAFYDGIKQHWGWADTNWERLRVLLDDVVLAPVWLALILLQLVYLTVRAWWKGRSND